MKHVFLLLTALTLAVFSSNAQSIEVINRQVTNDRATVNTLRDNLNSRGGGQAACGPDTLIYALAKATALNIVNVNNATSVFAVSQYFDVPQDITINGASFYGFKTDATGGIISDVSVSVYLAGPDSLPAGAPLTTGIVSVDTSFGGGSLAVLIKHANFTPVTVSQPYCVVVENDSPNAIGMVTSDYTAGDGQGEWLASANLFGEWLHGYELVLGPDQFDADALIEPHVEYNLEAGFDQTGICIGTSGGDGTWQNTSSPVLANRMYSVAAFLGSPELQYSWDYGDGSAITNTIDGTNTYTGNSPWTVTLTDTLFGWTIICVDDFIQDAETVEAGTLTADASPVCVGGTMSATEGDAPVVPSGYSVLYVLTDADNNLTVLDAAGTPSFPATTAGNFIIHTLVYDANTLDPATAIGLEAGVVNGLLVQGGGTICAALDLVGAPISVEGPEAGTLSALASPVCLSSGSADISATEGDAPVVPAGYSVLYVLTDADNNLTVLDAAATPDFTVNAAGNYIIHTLVYDANTLDPATAIGLEAGVVNGLLVQGGGTICAALDLVGAPISVEGPEAGTLTADASPVCVGGTMSATEGDAPVVPSGYSVLYVLTDADNNLTVLDAAGTPSFPATTAGNFIIHTLVYDANTLDPATAIGLEAGVVNGLLVQGGGTICAALDLVGAPISVEGPEAGTLSALASPVCLSSGSADISATEGDAPVVPAGYSVLYVLTDADNNLTVLDAAATPDFTVNAAGNYIIHTLVYDANTLDPATAIGLEAGVVNGLLVQGGGTICAALDLVGAPISVEGPEAGTLTAVNSSVGICAGGTAEISATEGDAPVVPSGYSVLYVLTDADNNLTVIDAAVTPDFTVNAAGNYIIHTLVYDAITLDPATAIGLEALTVNGLLVQGGGTICAALDLAGAPVEVIEPTAGTLTAVESTICTGGNIAATEANAPVVPDNYELLYVLTDADNNLTIVDAAAAPSFVGSTPGNFIIHTLVYDPNTLDPATLIGVEALVANGLLVQGGGTICAALDLAGAPVTVDGPTSGTLTADATPVCLDQGTADISATEGDAPIVPAGYSVLYVLTDADNNLTVLDAAATPEFTVNAGGNYIIHTLVYDPNTLDPTTAIGLEAGVVNGLLVQGGGTICAALDLAGAPITVDAPEAGTLTADVSPVCVGGAISATEDDAPVVPAGYSVLYVLTDADNNLTVLDAAATPSFPAATPGNYIIHTLVYDPSTLDPATAIGLEAGVVDGLLVQGGGIICAALDLAGAPITVDGPTSGTLTADATPVCLDQGTADISATEGDAPIVPTGYTVLYVLTDADNNLTVLDAAATPEFTVNAGGNYIIHTLVYDANTLDPATAIGLEAGVVNGLLVQGGGTICAALDLVGAPITVDAPEAGTLTADASPVCLDQGTADISATEGDAPVVPSGYSVLYVLTDADNNLTVLDAAATPEFTVNAGGNYIIHTLVYDPNTLDPTTAIGLEAGVVNGLLVQGGGTICAALDLAGAPITVDAPEAGTLTADATPVCLDQGTADISASEGDAPVVPSGYSVLYVLTDADNNLTVLDAAATPEFTVNAGGNYIIHTLVYDANTLDPATAIGLEAGVVNGLLVQGGGTICAALDLVGAPITVDAPEAGTLTADATPVCLDLGSADISATEGDAPVVPAGYSVLYVLTDADNNLTVIDAAATPEFTVTAEGNYIIHTLVYDANTLDPATAIGLEAGVVNGLLVQGGGTICAALDLAGAPISVEVCPCDAEAGTLTADASPVCVGGTMSATEGDAPVVPAGFSVLYVLTDADNNLTVLDAAAIPSFPAATPGNYIIHTLVYDPLTLDPTTAIGIEAGVVNGLLVQGGGTICAALDLAGAPITVEACPCDADAGTLIADVSPVCLANGEAVISATEATSPVVPAGYETIYVLTQGSGLVIVDAQAIPEFIVTSGGDYTIHTLVYDPNTLDLGIVQFGTTTGFDVNGLLIQGGGTICASLDVAGSPVSVVGPNAGSLVANAAVVCLDGGSADISASEVNAPEVPAGYAVFYVLTDADNNLEILNGSINPDFTVSGAGNYIIHTLVYDPNTLDPATAIGLPAADVNALLVQGGGSICAALDLAGAPITVEGPEAGSLTADASPVCLNEQGDATISATEASAPEVPAGYQVLYVLTDADNNLEILDAASTPEFTVSGAGNYIIHTLVYDPNTLTPTTAIGLPAADVNGLLVQGGGSICAALDLNGAPIAVVNCTSVREIDEESLAVYPNPSNGEFVIELSGVESEDTQMLVFDMSGRQVYADVVNINNDFRKELNLDVAKGTYLLQIVTIDDVVSRKLQIN